jgi:hypothetical protein
VIRAGRSCRRYLVTQEFRILQGCCNVVIVLSTCAIKRGNRPGLRRSASPPPKLSEPVTSNLAVTGSHPCGSQSEALTPILDANYWPPTALLMCTSFRGAGSRVTCIYSMCVDTSFRVTRSTDCGRGCGRDCLPPPVYSRGEVSILRHRHSSIDGFWCQSSQPGSRSAVLSRFGGFCMRECYSAEQDSQSDPKVRKQRARILARALRKIGDDVAITPMNQATTERGTRAFLLGEDS